MNEIVEKLKDIKPPVDVPDNSFWLLVGFAAVLLFFAALLFLLFKRAPKKRRRSKDPAEIAKSKLKLIDFEDSKSAVYAFDEYFPVAAAGDRELTVEFEKLFDKLERYKYKKEVPPLEREDRERMEALIKRVVS